MRVELADLYARQNNAPAAMVQAEAALAKAPANADANRILGMAYAEFADRNLPLRPGDDPATYLAKAIERLEKARTDIPDIGLDVVLGQLYLQSGAFDKAVPLLRRVVDSQPASIDAVVLLSTAAESAGRPDEAVSVLETFLRDESRLVSRPDPHRRDSRSAGAVGCGG